MTCRRDTFRRLRVVPIERLLVICYGNIYRSAYVGVALRGMVGSAVEVRSAGFHPKFGRAAPERLQRLALVNGIDLAGHRSSRVESSDLRWADAILLMDRHNWQELIRMGAKRERLIWLGVFDEGAPEVPDPYNLDDAATEAVVARLHQCSIRLASLIRSFTPPAT
jgi:protein-tyrosine phosphatase